MSKSKKAPNFYITEANYYQLTGPGFWYINDVPPERWAQIKDHFAQENTIAVFASGIDPHKIDAPAGAEIAGIDWIRLEPNPKGNEPLLNVDHYVIGPSDEFGFPVYGPYKEGAVVSHHLHNEDEIDKYNNC